MADETAIEDDIVHRSSHVPWGGASGLEDWIELGVDWSAATFAMNFSATKGGSPIAGLALANAAAGSQGISATYDATYVHPTSGAVVGATTIRPQINETAFEALTFTDPTEPLVYYYDLLVTPSGQPQQVYAFGTFTLYKGIGD